MVIIPTPVATEMDPLPTNPAGPDRSPTSIRHVLIPRCQPSWPVTRPTLFPLDVASQHFVYFSRVAALVAETFTRRVTSGLRDVLRAASVYSSSSRCTSVSNAFPIFRTVAPTDACQSAVTARVIAARPLPSTESTHRSHVLHSRTVCCQTVRDRSRRDNVVTITPNNRYLSAHSKISCGR